jgi:predicted ArsR family transcriptional regulator
LTAKDGQTAEPRRTHDAFPYGLGPRKDRILDLLDDVPGLNIDELADALQVRRTAAKHHVRGLERAGALVRLRQGRNILHFRADTPAIDRTLFCLLRIPSVQGVCASLLRDPWKTPADLAQDLEVAPRTIRRALHRLKRAGAVRGEPAPDGRRALHLHPRLRILLGHALTQEAGTSHDNARTSHDNNR